MDDTSAKIDECENGGGDGQFSGLSPRQIFEKRFALATASGGIIRAHARNTLAQGLSSCQDKLKIAKAIRSLHKPSPMPDELRKQRILEGVQVPDEDTPFVVISPNN